MDAEERQGALLSAFILLTGVVLGIGIGLAIGGL